MAQKYDLHHWDNSFVKSCIIVGICMIKNNVFLVYCGRKPVATFQTRKKGACLHFEKLGTLPSESNHGVGFFCMESIEDMARNLKCGKVTMEVYEPSRHAIAFY